jgi:hypothetical protein
MTWTPNPDMTFTGTKFRLNGYRTPWVAEKIEAGEEGALNGRRLVLGVDGYLSYHMRSLLLTQSKPSSDPAGPEPDASPVETQPFQSLAWDFTGPITENIGIWTEWYSTQANDGVVGNAYGPVDNDEYDVKMVFNPGDGSNIIGFGINNQPRTSPFFGAFGSGVASSQGNEVNMGVHAWLKDRVALNFAVIPGQGARDASYDYERMNYGFTAAVLPMNTDAMWLMFTGAFMTGNDMTPIGNVTGVQGVSGLTNPTTGAARNYTNDDLGDANRFLLDMRFGALDRGPWSWNSATAISLETETRTDGSKVKNTAVATSWRLFYERTYGLLFNVNKRLTYEYTEGNLGASPGTVHEIPSDLGIGLGFVYRQAMNFAWELQFSNAQSLRLGENWRNGWSWNLRWHFLY